MNPLRRLDRAPSRVVSLRDLYFDRLIDLDALNDEENAARFARRPSLLPGGRHTARRDEPVFAPSDTVGRQRSCRLWQQPYLKRSPRFGPPKADRFRQTNKGFGLSRPVELDVLILGICPTRLHAVLNDRNCKLISGACGCIFVHYPLGREPDVLTLELLFTRKQRNEGVAFLDARLNLRIQTLAAENFTGNEHQSMATNAAIDIADQLIVFLAKREREKNLVHVRSPAMGSRNNKEFGTINQ